jgi:hypothetical protein
MQMHYLKTWFAVDFLGAIPFDYIVYAIEQHYYSIWEGTKIIRLFKLLRLFRLLKLHNLYRFLGKFLLPLLPSPLLSSPLLSSPLLSSLLLPSPLLSSPPLPSQFYPCVRVVQVVMRKTSLTTV